MNSVAPPGGHIYLIAICGVGMASLAGLLKSQGYRVTGSDQKIYPPMSTYLEELGINVLSGYSKEHLSPRPDLVIIGNAVSRNNAEAEAVFAMGIPYISFPEGLGKFLIDTRHSIVVAGTHGKTTTTALLAWVLSCAGYQPGFFVGGMPINFGKGLDFGQGDYVVLEGDEYDTAFFDKGPKFLHYRPEKVILTSVEFDHADIYRDLDHVQSSFRRLLEIIPSAGVLISCKDYPATMQILDSARCRVITYGKSGRPDWEAKDVRPRQAVTVFEPSFNGSSEGLVEVNLIGSHNVQNALAVYAMGRELGLDHAALVDGLRTFRGVKRRQEIKGEIRRVLVIDDFAHHPTAVSETIGAVRASYPGRRLWAIFEPRSNTSRRRVFASEFARSLAVADRVVLSGIYEPDRIPEADRISPGEVVEDINRMCGDPRAQYVESSRLIPSLVVAEARAGDIVLIMSNGGFDGVQDKILEALASC